MSACQMYIIIIIIIIIIIKGFSSKCTLLKADNNRIGKDTVCRRVRASFSPEMLQAGQ